MTTLRPFALAWLLVVLGFMVRKAKPIELWSFGDFGLAVLFFCLFGPGVVCLATLLAPLCRAFGDAVADGYRKATKGRELDEAELE